MAMFHPLENTIYVFTDGSAKNNNTPEICEAGWGYFITGNICQEIKSFGKVPSLLSTPKGLTFASNQRAELLAVYKGLQNVADTSGSTPSSTAVSTAVSDVVLVTDSDYTRNIITKWWYDWVKNDKLESKKNLDIIAPMMDIITTIKIKYDFKVLHVNSHKTEPHPGTFEHFLWKGNGIADALAEIGRGERG